MRKFNLYSQLILIILLLSACSSRVSQTEQAKPLMVAEHLYADDLFTDYSTIAVESEEDVFAIDDEMKEMVATKLLPVSDPKYRARKLLYHLFSKDDEYLSYESDANLTAIDTYHSKTANCLSLTIMAYVLAKEAGLNIVFQDVDVPEFWIRNGKYNLITGHVNLSVHVSALVNTISVWNFSLVIDFDPFIAKKTFPKKRISKQTVLAMFYVNKGAHAITEGLYTKAYAYFKQATLTDPSYASAWSNLGILYRLNNRYDLSESAYKYALTLSPDNLTTLENYAILKEKKGFFDESKSIRDKIHNERVKNPFYQALMADEALYKGDLEKAKTHFKYAIRLNRRVHEFYYGLARVYHQLGERDKAEDALTKAIKLNKTRTTEKQYVAKLDFLRAETHIED
ncbi:tetratricopeptide repeat protein [Thalassotalea piscium]